MDVYYVWIIIPLLLLSSTSYISIRILSGFLIWSRTNKLTFNAIYTCKVLMFFLNKHRVSVFLFCCHSNFDNIFICDVLGNFHNFQNGKCKILQTIFLEDHFCSSHYYFLQVVDFWSTCSVFHGKNFLTL